ncbi:hypothetical protein LRS06_12825 [Hymenobacter sp. J193]|uniref:hypothetical protein n=1 Tax=Hymenobacter sp. J193 TaxID=2898429 RepID=UPI0021517407|nr:hypothetical protein [Hymenobacter sp. J193]MCR5888632.1 hypothetical protein [Hymenobacter sp. J193]
MRAIHCLPAAGLVILLGCNNKIDFGPNEGYTGRDNSNYPVGSEDKTDWTSDEKWNKKELALFDDLGLELNGYQAGGVRRVTLYPNPVENMAVFSQDVTSSFSKKIKLVDKKYKVVLERDAEVASHDLALNTSALKLKKGATYRLYYVYYNGSILHYKGHGDIQMAN